VRLFVLIATEKEHDKEWKVIMFLYKKDIAPCFDDILLVPQKSNIQSRHDVDLTMEFGGISLSLPVIAAPMDTVCDVDMCITMANFGGMGILHRYMSYEDQLNKSKFLVNQNVGFGVAIGSNNGYLEHAKHLYDAGVTVFLIDTANGHGEYAIKAVYDLRDNYPDIHIMAGNVATQQAFMDLAKAGANSVRVGIGGGSACTTRLVSGHGIPTLASIMDVEEWRSETDNYDCAIIADGGIRNSGDMVKAFAAGADAVMVGSLLAGTDESPGDILTDAYGKEFKHFRGMASVSAQNDANGRVSVAEGISTTIPYKGSAVHILNQIRGGLGSGCSYAGTPSLKYIYQVAEYVVVSSLSTSESRPHAL